MGGQKPEGGHIFKMQYWMYAATGGLNLKRGAPVSNGGAGHHWHPCWRRPCREGSQNIAVAKGGCGITWIKELNLLHISIYELNSIV